MRGCTPVCRVRSITSAALPAASTAASTTAAGGPAMVTTERLWSASCDQSSSDTPGTRMVRTMASTRSVSTPSEKFGTHSMMAFVIPVTALLPPAVSDLELHRRVHAGIGIAEGRVGDVYRIRIEGNRALGFEKVLKAHPKLGREVPHTRALVSRRRKRPYRRKFVVGPYQSTGTLHKGHDSPASAQVPAQHPRRHADAVVGASGLV